MILTPISDHSNELIQRGRAKSIATCYRAHSALAAVHNFEIIFLGI